MATFATATSTAATACSTPQTSRTVSTVSLLSPTSTIQNMKALPRSPAASTVITSTMVNKAFHSNNQKRGLTEMMAAPPPPPTPTSRSSTSNSNNQNHSYLDCQSLQSSLKRVRLSSSPGELRLQRDLRHLVTSGQWQPQQQSHHHAASPSSGNHHHHQDVWSWHPPAPPLTARHDHPTPPFHVELVQVESLRLRLTYNHSIVVWIQVPRMYPHRPPAISRIVYNNNNNHHQGGIQRVVVHEAPPMGVLSTNNLQTHNGVLQDDDALVVNVDDKGPSSPIVPFQCANTVIYNDWSPVQRLGNLLEFVIQVFQQQEQERRSSRERQISQKQLPSWTSDQAASHGWSWDPKTQPERMVGTDAVVEEFLNPNRFNVGYNYAEFRQPRDEDDDHMDVADNHQESSMDLL